MTPALVHHRALPADIPSFPSLPNLSAFKTGAWPPYFSAGLGLEKAADRLLSGPLATTTALLIKGELRKPEQGTDARGPRGEHGADAEQ